MDLRCFTNSRGEPSFDSLFLSQLSDVRAVRLLRKLKKDEPIGDRPEYWFRHSPEVQAAGSRGEMAMLMLRQSNLNVKTCAL